MNPFDSLDDIGDSKPQFDQMEVFNNTSVPIDDVDMKSVSDQEDNMFDEISAEFNDIYDDTPFVPPCEREDAPMSGILSAEYQKVDPRLVISILIISMTNLESCLPISNLMASFDSQKCLASIQKH
jgi:hypothetical protein